MAQLTPRFFASLTVREYAEERYLPAAAAYHERAANNGTVGNQLLDWQLTVDQKWGALRFGHVRVDTQADHYVLEVELFLNDLDPNAPADATSPCVYRGTAPTTRPASDYTTRVIPRRAGVAVPLDSARILWQH